MTNQTTSEYVFDLFQSKEAKFLYLELIESGKIDHPGKPVGEILSYMPDKESIDPNEYVKICGVLINLLILDKEENVPIFEEDDYLALVCLLNDIDVNYWAADDEENEDWYWQVHKREEIWDKFWKAMKEGLIEWDVY